VERGSEEVDPTTKAAQIRTRHIIARLKSTGWLETETVGLRTTVEMTLPAVIFIERMVQVRKGLVFQLNNVLASLKPRRVGFWHSRKARQFIRNVSGASVLIKAPLTKHDLNTAR
jgi:hypothetical protein